MVTVATVFDLDGTLAEHLQSGDRLYEGAFERSGIERFGAPADLWAALDGPPPSQGRRVDYLADGFATVAADHGVDADARALAEGFVETVDWTRMALLPGAEEAMAAAIDAGPTALLTNGPEYRQATKLAALGLTDTFDAVVFAGDMARRKPHRDPFDRTLELLDVRAETALYVGNSLEYDVAGAANAGIDVAWVPDGEDRDPGDHEPTYLLDSLHDLPPILAERGE